MNFVVISLEMRSLSIERIFPGDTIMRKNKNAEGIQSMTVETGLGLSQRNNKGCSVPPVTVLLLLWIALKFKEGVILGRALLNVPFHQSP